MSAMPGRRYALPRHPGAISIVHLTQKVPIGEVRVRYPRALHRGGARESMIGAELSTVRCVLLVPCRTEIARLVGIGRAAGFRMGLWVMCHHFPTLSRSIRATARFLSARDPKVLAKPKGCPFLNSLVFPTGERCCWTRAPSIIIRSVAHKTRACRNGSQGSRPDQADRRCRRRRTPRRVRRRRRVHPVPVPEHALRRCDDLPTRPGILPRPPRCAARRLSAVVHRPTDGWVRA